MDYQALVDRINEAMNDTENETMEMLAALSRQYAAACHEVNIRLSECGFFLDTWNNSEALRLANIYPPLLPLCDQLEFDNHDEWVQICQTFPGLTKPENLYTTISYRLKEYELEGEEMEKKLRFFRIQTIKGVPVIERLKTLCELMKTQPENEMWQRLRGSYEEAAAQEIEAQFKSAQTLPATSQKVLYLQQLVGSIPWRTQPVILQKWIKKVEVDRIVEEGTKIVDRMELACRNGDYDLVISLLDEWNQKITSKNVMSQFRPETIKKFRSVQEWLTNQKTLFENDNSFKLVLNEMNQLLREKNFSAFPLVQCWKKLQIISKRSRIPIPQEVQFSYEAQVKKYKKKQRLMLFTLILIIVLFAGCLVLGIMIMGSGKGAKSAIPDTKTSDQRTSLIEKESSYVRGIC